MTANRIAEVPDDALAVYDGRHHLGWTLRRGKAFEAVRPDRTTVGVFDTILKARNALWCGEG
ncbi:hypothetical protein [Bradyrhizobium sp. URHC0002]